MEKKEESASENATKQFLTIQTMRIAQIDNMKAFLILTVVFGHFLEWNLSKDSSRSVYLLLYSFHMPAFVFVTGLMAKYRSSKIKWNFFLLYMVFQTIFLKMDARWFEGDGKLQYTKPYWVLWYLLAYILWMILLPLFETKKRGVKILQLLLAFVVGILAGYDESIGYTLSLSRILVFLPFFLAGYYCEFTKHRKEVLRVVRFPLTALVSFAVAIVGMRWIWKNAADLKLVWFYHTRAYAATEMEPVLRVKLYIISIAMILLLLLLVPDKKIPVLTTIGQRSLNVFLLHVFVQRYVLYKNYFEVLPAHLEWICLGLAIVCVLVLSIEPIDFCIRKLFFFNAEELYEKTKEILHRIYNKFTP